MAVDAIESAAKGGNWVDICAMMSRCIGADAAAVVVWNTRDGRVLEQADYQFPADLAREYSERFYQHDPLVQYAEPSGSWQVSNEKFGDRRWQKHPFFGDLMHRHKVRQIAALTLELDDDVIAGLSLHRSSVHSTQARDFKEGQLAVLTARMSAAFAQRHSTARVVRASLQQALSYDGAVCFLVNGTGQARPLAGEQGLRDVGPLKLTSGWLRHEIPTIQQRLISLASQAARGKRSAIFVPLRGVGALRIDALPLPLAGSELGTGSWAIMCATPRKAEQVPAEQALREFFELTPMQARTLRLLCEGLSVKEIAESCTCSTATVRTHVAQLLSRMSCNRQAQLVQRGMMLAL